ncbi:MAG TPA: glycosyltransferase family 9 protein [Fimbriimonadaceae bacterium]|nr:glycosyltransferase family 9 protein [Fimbriimonadaceae bacterium]
MSPSFPLVGKEALTAALSRRPPERILLVGRDQLGDAVNTTGAVDSILRRFPDAEFVLEVGAAGAGVFQGFSDRLVVVSRARHQGVLGKLKRVAEWRRRRFDLVVILDDVNEPVRLARLAGIPVRVGIHYTKHANLFTAYADRGRVERDTLWEGLTGVLDLLSAEIDLKPRLYPGTKDKAEVPNLPAGPLVGLHVGASDRKKEWPVERFVELADLLSGCTPLVLCGPGEEELLRIARERGCLTVPPLPSVLAYAEMIGRLDVLVTADTGPAHLAVATDTPVVIIYGPTSPDYYRPFGSKWTALHHPGGCRHYSGICEGERDAGACDRRCIRQVTVESVEAAVTSYLVNR